MPLQGACDPRPAPTSLASSAPPTVSATAVASTLDPAQICAGCSSRYTIYAPLGCMRQEDAHGPIVGPQAMATATPVEWQVKPCDPSCCAVDLARQCAGETRQACFDLGVLLAEGRHVPRDDARAAALFTRACGTDLGTECQKLGTLLDGRRDRPDDDARAPGLLAGACDKEFAGACLELGSRLEEGRGMRKDEARAEAIYAKSCDHNHGQSCFNLGALLAKRPGAVSQAHATAAYARGCALGSQDACGRTSKPH